MRASFEDRSAPAVTIRCEYADGDPADAEVLVHSPAEPTRIFQRLRTDLRGRASFVPDAPGLWRVVADDGLGHRVELELPIDAAGVAAPPDDAGAVPARLALLAALAVAACAWWALRARKESS